MAKNKNKQPQQPQLTPEKYIRLKGRNLPIVKCEITEDWKDIEQGPFMAIVTRQHVNGNFTCGVYLVDIGCLGVKDSDFCFNVLKFEYDDFIEEVKGDIPFTEISYNEVHNIIYGAVGYADELGIKPHKTFDLTEYLLDEDTDDFPLIEYEFGKNGKPYLVANDRLEASRYLSILEEATGGDFEYTILDDDDDDDDEEDEDDSDFNFFDFDDDNIPFGLAPSEYPETPYTYEHPVYPDQLNLVHSELQRFFTSPSQMKLTREEINAILALPRESLIEDLKQVVLYSLGRAYCDRDAENFDNYTSIIHALFFLGELRAEESLDVVLEFMRQGAQSWSYQIGDLAPNILGLTLYYVGRNNLPALLDFAKETGLYSYFKAIVFIAVNFVADEPGRRPEVLDWYREILRFYETNGSDIHYYSARFGALMINELADLNPVELIPEILHFYEKSKVDDVVCGNYKEVSEIILAGEEPARVRLKMDIIERYEDYANYFGYK